MKNKGITLIALVITIVILMILAGISIGALTGDNGIINQTRDAKENTEIQEEREAVDISAVEASNKNRFGTITQENLQKALDNYVGNGETNSTSPFLGNSDIQRRFVKSVKIVPTLDGHVKGEGTCWDVSESQKGSILAWYTEEIIDDTTFYNVTHRKS